MHEAAPTPAKADLSWFATCGKASRAVWSTSCCPPLDLLPARSVLLSALVTTPQHSVAPRPCSAALMSSAFLVT